MKELLGTLIKLIGMVFLSIGYFSFKLVGMMSTGIADLLHKWMNKK